MDSGLLFQTGLQLAQRPIGMARQQSGQHFLVELAAGTGTVSLPLHLAAASAGGGNLPRPSPAHTKTLGQLDQARLTLIVSLQ
ncbi:MAG: hypothetical protein ACRD28_02305 [Acidobacteriaceae bacterium]